MSTKHYSFLERRKSSRHNRRNPDRYRADPENPLQQRLGHGFRGRTKFIPGEGHGVMLSLYSRKRGQIVILPSVYTYWTGRLLRQVSSCFSVTGGARYAVCVYRQGFFRLCAPLGPNEVLRCHGNHKLN